MPKARLKLVPPRLNEGEELFAFQCKAAKLPSLHRQFSFAERFGRKFTADFAWPVYQLIVEVNGGIWRKGGGAHSRPSKIIGDMERQRFMVFAGFFYLPVTPDDVFSGSALEWTERALRTQGWRPGKPE